MDRRQHINSSLSKTSSIESVKQKTTNGNAMNNNHQHIGYRRNSSSIDSSASANYRKSFPTTLDNSLNNSIQVIIFLIFSSFNFHFITKIRIIFLFSQKDQ